MFKTYNLQNTPVLVPRNSKTIGGRITVPLNTVAAVCSVVVPYNCLVTVQAMVRASTGGYGSAKNGTTAAATDIVTSTAHGYTDGTSVLLTALATTTGISVGTIYYVRDVTTNTFKLAATAGGSAIDLATGDGTLTVRQVPTAGVYFLTAAVANRFNVTTLVGTPVIDSYEDSATAADIAVTVTADDSNEALLINGNADTLTDTVFEVSGIAITTSVAI